uniref:DNA-directed RNA polymerase n=1 Tax=Schizomeris leibleinii TaxID=104533 RepID=F8SYD9_9CHLO|nr:beta subunit of RNA polymerase [Schizomeris leibleinii]AEH05413.1 beta subunit of RNA polymerase [Schizomeris leibleinii]
MIDKKSIKILPVEYTLQTYYRSNQDTTLVNRPAVVEGDWVQSGDLLADCSSSKGGEFSIGRNILIAYLPWEGYNYEDAILISERLVFDDLYTSIHIERYETGVETTAFGEEKITKEIPQLKDTIELDHLDKNGIAYLGSWLKDGDILVGKITPTEPKKILAPYTRLYNDIIGKKLDYAVRDTSLRMPRGLEAKVIKVKIFKKFMDQYKPLSSKELHKSRTGKVSTIKMRTLKKIHQFNSKLGKYVKKAIFFRKKHFAFNQKKSFSHINKINLLGFKNHLEIFFVNKKRLKYKSFLKEQKLKGKTRVLSLEKLFAKKEKNKLIKKKTNSKFIQEMQNKVQNKNLILTPKKTLSKNKKQAVKVLNSAKPAFGEKPQSNFNLVSFNKEKNTSSLLNEISSVHIYLAEKRKIQVGDKMAGRHGNKGIISQILPRQDMPYLPDGTPIDLALNPLGVPSRMNVGQIYECLLGLAGKYLSEQYRIMPFDELYGPEASRSFVFSKLLEAKQKTGQSWIFQPNNPGKMKLFDGRTGYCFDQAITTGYSYMIKLVHLVDDKIHCLTYDHDVLTSEGWIPLNQVKTSHFVATLQKDGQLVYQNPTEIYHYNNFKGELYHIKNTNVEFLVTLNHRMFVKKGNLEGESFEYYKLLPAKKLIGHYHKYLKTCKWNKEDYKFKFPNMIDTLNIISEKKLEMNAWLKFFGICLSESFYLNNTIQISQSKKHVFNFLKEVLLSLGYSYFVSNNKVIINDKQLVSYFKQFCLTEELKRLPSWIWEVSEKQAQLLLTTMIYVNGTSNNLSSCYYTRSNGLADDIMRLALHAGWSGNKFLHLAKGDISIFNGTKVINNNDLWGVSIIQNNTNQIINNQSTNKQYIPMERIIQYNGSVFCLSVPNQVFYVRCNGLTAWTGNSRGTGPYSLVTQQPLKGRSKHGGQRLGEMEVWALEAYGAAFTLLELLTIKSDDVTGRLTIWDYVLYKRPLYIGTPASFKVLVCELESLCLDIGIYKSDTNKILRQIKVSNMG